MSVAEKPVAEKIAQRPHLQLAWSSLLGAVYVLFSIGMVLVGIPLLWAELGIPNEYLSGALLLMVLMGAAVGFVLLGLALEGKNPPRGLRAGVFFAALTILLTLWMAQGVGLLLLGAELDANVGIGVMVATALGLFYVASRMFANPGFADWLAHVEDHGWFHAVRYKVNQGWRVRFGTLVALFFLGACGIYTLWLHGSFGNDRLGSNDWVTFVPFTSIQIPIMFRVHWTMPLILFGLLIWVPWRLVNWPLFADFLIATDAEMNKVSWTTRKRLFQDTIVVLVTVILLTTFLFFVDILWIRILSGVQVLRVDVRAEQMKQTEKTQW